MRLPWDKAAIETKLPHRSPFLFVDQVSELIPEKSIKGHYRVPEDADYLKGHFPSFPVLPGVLLVEALAQCAVVLGSESSIFDPKEDLIFLIGVDKVKFRKLIRPGDKVDLEGEFLSFRKGIVQVQGRAFVNGERAGEAVIKAAIRKRES